MRIKYFILWIENDKSWQSTAQKLIEVELIDLGFIPIINAITGEEELKELLAIKPDLKEYDIILVDYKLNNEEQGNVLIEQIRNNEIYTDVLFYSQDINALRDAFRSLELEGVYTSSRANFEERFSKIMKTTIKKVEEVSTLRGLIMAETSTLDEMMLSIIKKYLNNASSKKKEVYIAYLFSKVEESVTTCNKIFRELKDKNDVETLIETPLLFTLFQKSLGINKIIKQSENIEIKIFKGYHEDFNKKIIQIRNIFAHVEEKEENGNIVLVDTKGMQEVFSSERCVEIRKDILAFSEKLEGINKIV